MESILEVQNLIKTYRRRKGKSIRAVDDVSLSIPSGEIFGLLGNNGAGKTTTVKMICGLIRPDSGSIVLNGHSIVERKRALRQISAVLEGNRNIYWRLTAYENLEYFASINGIRPRAAKVRISQLLDRFDLEHKSNEPARNLSRGMQQKLAIAVALVVDTPIVVLDEPTLGLDVQSSHEIRSFLRQIVAEERKTILLTSHDMNVVEDICQQVAVINNGKIVAQDRVENLLALFQVQSYAITVKNPVDAGLKESLIGLCYCDFVSAEEWTRITVNLESHDQLYEVMEILRNAGAELVSVERQNPNFEEVYLNLVGKGVAS